jgi:hypothetical protein
LRDGGHRDRVFSADSGVARAHLSAVVHDAALYQVSEYTYVDC